MKLIKHFTLFFILIITPLPSIANEDSEYLKNSLSVGEKASNFTLPNAFGEQVDLYSLLEKSHVILTFYRGGWCPICNVQLHDYQEYLDIFKNNNAQLVAVSPETPTNAQLTLVQNALQFEVLSDLDNSLAKQYGILWEIPEEKREKFSAWLIEKTGKDLKGFNDVDTYYLPIPATFVIRNDGIVVYAFKDVDYRNRAEADDIVKALEALKN